MQGGIALATIIGWDGVWGRGDTGEGLGGVVWERYVRDSVAITDSQQYILKKSIEMTDNNTLQTNSVYALTHAHTLNVRT